MRTGTASCTRKRALVLLLALSVCLSLTPGCASSRDCAGSAPAVGEEDVSTPKPAEEDSGPDTAEETPDEAPENTDSSNEADDTDTSDELEPVAPDTTADPGTTDDSDPDAWSPTV